MPLFLTNLPVTLYFLLYVTLAVNYYLLNGDRNNRITIFFCILLFFTNFAFQSYTIGFSPDKIVYELKYQNFELYKTVKEFGLGYGLYCFYYVLNFFNVEPANLRFYYSFFLNLLLLLFCLKKSFRNESFLLMFIFSMSWFVFDMFTNSIRQGVSSLFFLFFIMNMISKQNVKSTLYAFLSLAFHWTAIVPLVIAFILYKRTIFFQRKHAIIYVFISGLFFMSIFIPTISLRSFLYLFAELMNFPFLSLKVNSYLGGYNIYTVSLFDRMSLFYEPIIFTAFILFFYLFINKFIKNRNANFLANVFWILMLYAVLNISMDSSYRNFYWAQILFPVVLVQLIDCIKGNVNIELRAFYLGIISIVFVVSSFGLWRSGILHLLYN
jgi:hypothetical protein